MSTRAVTTLAGPIGFSKPHGLSINAAGTKLLVIDFYGDELLEVQVATGALQVIAGTGVSGYLNGASSTAQVRGAVC